MKYEENTEIFRLQIQYNTAEGADTKRGDF